MSPRFLLTMVLLTALALAVPPRFIGSSVESNLRAAVQELDQAPYVAAEVTEYERGWFDARASVRLGFDEQLLEEVERSTQEEVDAGLLTAQDAQARRDAMRAVAGETLPLLLRINHGPIVTTLDGTRLEPVAARFMLDPQDERVAELTALLSAQALLKGELHSDFAGHVSVHVDGSPVRLTQGDARLMASAWSADLRHERRSATARARVDLPAITIEETLDGEKNTLRLEGMQVASRSAQVSPRVWTGLAEATIGRLAGTVDGIPFEVTEPGMRYEVGVAPDGESIRITGEVVVKRFLFDDVAGSVSVPFAFDGLTVSLMEQMSRVVEDAAARGAAPDDTAMAQAALALLYASPALRLGPVAVTAGEEALDASVDLRIEGASLRAIGPDVLLNAPETIAPADALAILQGSRIALDVTPGIAEQIAQGFIASQLRQQLAADPARTVDPATLQSAAEQQAQQIISMLVVQGLITRSPADHYTIALGLNHSSIDLNGNALPLSLIPGL